MESPSTALTLSSTTTATTARRRRISSDSANSPEFEFWSLRRNPSAFPDPAALHSADELFSDGVLLPLRLLPNPRSDPEPEPEPEPEPGPRSESAAITSTAGNPLLTASKRWKEIFKRGEREKKTDEKPAKSTVKRREKKSGSTGNGNNSNNSSNNGGSNSAELNINIWPFSRSRSAGNNSGRSKPAGSTVRKVSSAPCSRSNSSGESKSHRSWPSSPGRAGLYVGRTSPVWQVRRGKAANRGGSGGGGKGRVLNLNVPMCIGYRQNLGCRSEAAGGGDGGGVGGGSDGLARSGGVDGGGSNGNMFSLRGLFSKKSVLTV